MIKQYSVTAELNMCSEKEITVTVKANTKHKAEIFAKEKINKLYKPSFIIIRSITEISNDE